MKIRIAIAGVGNCASALIQGLAYYGSQPNSQSVGLAFPVLAGYAISDIEVVCAFDIDQRKVGKPISEAIFAQPNCAEIFYPSVQKFDAPVFRGPTLDGMSQRMSGHADTQKTFQESSERPVDVAVQLKRHQAELLVCYLPVGSEKAVRFYAEECLKADVGFINCVPVFIATDAEMAQRFYQAKLPLVGDDIKSQFGATILHRTIVDLLEKRGLKLKRSYQINVGGNTDFLNMRDLDRLESKKISKTEAVSSQLRGAAPTKDLHIGPSDYIEWLNDNKVCFLRVEAEGFGGAKLDAEIRLSVQDSPNSAGVVVDAIRAAAQAKKLGLGGPLKTISAYCMKRPPEQLTDHEVYELMREEYLK